MIVVGKHYTIVYSGSVSEYSRRGEWGGTGHAWSGIIRIQSVRGKFISVFRLGTEVNSPRSFNSEHLFTRSQGDAHYEDFVEALPGKCKELVDYIAERLVMLASGRREDEPLAHVEWSGLERQLAVRLGFVADRKGQVAMRV